jgi:hypothetical protein
VFKKPNEILANNIYGSYGLYPNRGFKIDFDADRIENTNKINSLKVNNWIDEDTRCL